MLYMKHKQHLVLEEIDSVMYNFHSARCSGCKLALILFKFWYETMPEFSYFKAHSFV